MRLKPRNIKRLMFACTQCGQCIDACDTVQRSNPDGGLLDWIADQEALQADGSQGLLPSEPTVSPKPLKLSVITPSPSGRGLG
jgi:ferredoxin